MKASDIAYLITLVQSDTKEKEPLVKELQEIYRTAQERRYGDRFRVPVMSELSVFCE